MAPSQSQPKKAPTKPMWVDVSVLPRIPKIKRESSSVAHNGTSQGGSSRNSNSRGSSSSSTTNHGYGLPEMGMNSLAGDKTRQQSVDQQRGRSDSQAQRHRPDGAGSSSAFSNSFSSSSSSAGSQAGQSRYSSSSSSSSAAVSFRINSSGNSWHSRRLSITSPSTSGGSMQEPWREKEDEARKRQLHRDKQMLLASRTLVNKEQDSNNIYDPFNPTLSDSNSSDGEAGSSSLDSSSRKPTKERKASSLGKDLLQRKQKVHVKSEPQETEISQEEPHRSNPQETISPDVKEEKKPRLIDIKVEKQTVLLDTKIKKEPGVDDAEEAERCGHSAHMCLNSETAPVTQTAHHSLVLVKTEKETLEEPSGQRGDTPNSDAPNCKNDPSASTKKKQKVESKLDSTTSSKSPPSDLAQKKKTSKASKGQRSSSSEMDRGRRGDHHSSGQGDRQKEKEKNKERSSRRSRSREKKRARSISESSQSNSPDRTSRKRQRSRSRSKGRRRSR